MSEHVQELINKIKSEGVEAAEKKAQDIEQQAREKAESITRKARQDAERTLADAREEIKKQESKTRLALEQAARDMILALRKDIEKNLHKIIAAEVTHTLTTEQLSKTIEAIVEHFLKEKSGEIDLKVLLNQSDLKKLQEGFTDKLKNKIKNHSLEFEASGDINKGFIISFDKGKSGFEFTDSSLAEYLSAYLNSEIASLLKEAVVSSKK